MDPIRSIQPIGSRVAEVAQAPALRPVGPNERQGGQGTTGRKRKRRQGGASENEGEDQQRDAQRRRKGSESDDDRAFGEPERLPARRSEDRGGHPGPHIDISA